MRDDYLPTPQSELKIRKGCHTREDFARDDAESSPLLEEQDTVRVKKRQFVRLIFCSPRIFGVFFAAVIAGVMARFARHASPIFTAPIFTNYTPPGDTINKLLTTYEKVMSSAELTLSPGYDSFVALMLDRDKILCRRSHMAKLTQSRASAYVQMLRRGLQISTYHFKNQTTLQNEPLSDTLPIILIESDSNGCNILKLSDIVGFPRLTWSTPALKYGLDWCAAIDVPGYESWWAFRNKKDTTGDSRKNWYPSIFDLSWELSFKNNNRRYTWNSKIKRAVWRGSTTGLGSNFMDLPRAKLVKQSMMRPDLIDAGFTKFVQAWESERMDLVARNRTIAKEHMAFHDQMKYRAIIDIDGNRWSSRFSKLLCTNSVVIKIDPDWIESFYGNLQPMKHYIPATLENITDVVAYVLDSKNDAEMRETVIAANLWCKRKMTGDQLSRDAVSQLGKYEMAIHTNYNSSWLNDWKNVKQRIFHHIGEDLVHCEV
ncbi:hypothetical protein ACHAW6_013206 [Cyclotella cf. meneghiniana]